MENSQTLIQALDKERVDNYLTQPDYDHQKKLLTDGVESFTYDQMVDFLNCDDLNKITLGQLSSLRKFAKMRIKKGYKVLPWSAFPGLDLNECDDNMGGGAW